MTSKLTREQLHERARENVKALKMASRQTAFESAREEILADLQLAELALAAMDSEPNRNPVLAYADSYRDMAKQGVESVQIWSVITDLERNIAPLYRHAQPAVDSDFIPKNLDKALGVLGMAIPESREEFNFQTERWIQRLIDRVIRYADEFQEQPAPVVDADDNFYSWFGREWQDNYQHNQYTTAAKQMLGVMAESAWKAGRRAAMLQELQKSAGASNNCRSNEKVQAVQVQPLTGINPASALGSLPKTGEVLPTNYPVIPDGYVMLPKEPTKEMIYAGWLHYMGTKNPSSKGTYKAMLAAATQEVK